jgi:hypothetical protein
MRLQWRELVHCMGVSASNEHVFSGGGRLRQLRPLIRIKLRSKRRSVLVDDGAASRMGWSINLMNVWYS